MDRSKPNHRRGTGFSVEFEEEKVHCESSSPPVNEKCICNYSLLLLYYHVDNAGPLHRSIFHIKFPNSRDSSFLLEKDGTGRTMLRNNHPSVSRTPKWSQSRSTYYTIDQRTPSDHTYRFRCIRQLATQSRSAFRSTSSQTRQTRRTSRPAIKMPIGILTQCYLTKRSRNSNSPHLYFSSRTRAPPETLPFAENVKIPYD